MATNKVLESFQTIESTQLYKGTTEVHTCNFLHIFWWKLGIQEGVQHEKRPDAVNTTVMRVWKRPYITHRSLFTWTSVLDRLCSICVRGKDRQFSKSNHALSHYIHAIYTPPPLPLSLTHGYHCQLNTSTIHNMPNSFPKLQKPKLLTLL